MVSNPIPLSAPDICDDEIRAVSNVLHSGRLSQGQYLAEFERVVARRLNRTHAIGVSSGTAALHLALAGLDVGPDDEVITPAFSFIASANCIMYVGAKPVFVDCDPRTLNVKVADAEKLITEKTKAIIGVHVFGNPAGMLELASLATRYEIDLIEDACQGFGGRKGKDPIGRFGRVAALSFYASKPITCAEGGMVVTHDDKLAETCCALRNHGRMPEPVVTEHGQEEDNVEEDMTGLGLGFGAALGSTRISDRIGYDYRMSELHAAIGVAQMRRIDEIIEARQSIAQAYTQRLLGNPHLIVPTVDTDTEMSWFVYVVRLTDQFSMADRNNILAGLRRHEIGATSYFPPIPSLPPYRSRFGYKPGDFPVAESVSHRTIALPFFTRMTERDVDAVCQTLEFMIKRQTLTHQEQD